MSVTALEVFKCVCISFKCNSIFVLRFPKPVFFLSLGTFFSKTTKAIKLKF